jgi:hypothetical protein
VKAYKTLRLPQDLEIVRGTISVTARGVQCGRSALFLPSETSNERKHSSKLGE